MFALFGLLLPALLVAACGQDMPVEESAVAPAAASPTPTTAATLAPSTPEMATEPLDDLLAATVPATSSAATVENEVEEEVQEEIIAILIPTPTPQVSVGIVNAALINIRSAPNLDADVVRIGEAGEQLAILAASPDGSWLQVCCADGAGESQWVAAEFIQADEGLPEANRLTPDAAGTDEEAADEEGTDGEGGEKSAALVTADLVNLRGGPGTLYPVVGQAAKDDTLDIIGKNEAGDWWQLCCASESEDEQRWIIAELVTVDPELVAALPVAVSPPTPEPAAIAVGGPEQGAILAAASAPGLPGDGGFGAPGGANPLTGRPLAADRQGTRPVIVCINNDYAARPQYGISQADVMYEYIMEGFGITRFSGVYFGDNVSQIGPVRSARLINYYLGALYNAGLACSGASDRVRYTLKHEAPFPYMDIDLDDPSNTRYSVSIGQDYRTRLRTETGKLWRWLAEWGAQEPARLRGFTFGDAGGGAPASSIAIPYPSATGSQVAYTYDGGSGRYLRSMGAAPHLDGNSGAQVGVENVVVQVVPHEITDIVEDSLGSKSIRLNLFGSGLAIVFRDGQAYEGTWRSESRGDLPRFYRPDGSEIALKPGRTWVSVVPPDYAVSYR